MSNEPDIAAEFSSSESPSDKAASDEVATDLIPAAPVHDLAVSVARVEAAPTLAEKGRLLRALSPDARYQTLDALPAPVVAALIEGDPDNNMAMIANLPAEKYRQVINLGTPAQGRSWLERAVG